MCYVEVMKNDRTDAPPFGETLENRIKVPPKVHAEFRALLDAPAKSNEKLSRLMNAPQPWESK
ncbi:MAG: hypothetical protein E5W15_18980 [Mesorhizobium sp.]|uniref:DUF1778 domain-containing protein n=1 Tax=Mesorhizobium sp. TaxID=1871066 RepID=UPI000FE50C48|nr:DUF1778 domain-containing protein [Mesorhizobium sp.]RWC09640.1 MAG: hypothetical protein EOS52_27120 [Mesorhizobium sp.]TIU68279.1 MAG: hypothetical protein E5W15_18980 [Mesorhizobium sp.]TIW88499.1 MAG: hypothetical protein E5V52_01665 [Mesorhizobium sp.]